MNQQEMSYGKLVLRVCAALVTLPIMWAGVIVSYVCAAIRYGWRCGSKAFEAWLDS